MTDIRVGDEVEVIYRGEVEGFSTANPSFIFFDGKAHDPAVADIKVLKRAVRALKQGDTITGDEIRRRVFPTGTVIHSYLSGPRFQFVKHADGNWQALYNSRRYEDDQFIGNSYIIDHLPD